MALGDDFEQVLAAARTGADHAWARIYRDLAPTVLGYLRGQRAPDPEGVVAETFLQVVRDLHRFDGGEDGFRSWVFAIAHNRLIDARRRAGRRREDLTTHEDIARDAPVVHAEDEALSGLATDELLALLDHLTDEQRTVLLLRVVADLSIEEVAAATGRSQGAVKQLQRRALVALRKRIGRDP